MYLLKAGEQKRSKTETGIKNRENVKGEQQHSGTVSSVSRINAVLRLQGFFKQTYCKSTLSFNCYRKHAGALERSER